MKCTKKYTEQEVIEFLTLEAEPLLDEFHGLDCYDILHFAAQCVEKQIFKKPIRKNKNKEFDGNWWMVCPTCGRILMERITTEDESYPRIYNHTLHCDCGQSIDWE